MLRFQNFLGLLFLILISQGIFQSCKGPKAAQAVTSTTFRLAFYNVENLFDTLDHTLKADDDFTPTGRNQWNTERYFEKINQLSKVVAAMEFPSILGLCEIENDTVIRDFIEHPAMKPQRYGLIHFQSPDERGIDNALIYKTDHFKVLESSYIRIEFPEDMEEDFTRDIVYVNGKLAGDQELHVFVNHWPSRRGGVEASEPKRMLAAGYLRKAVDEIFSTTPDAHIIIMGDFNDETDNRSVKEVLGAHTDFEQLQEKSLYNCMADPDRKGLGTYNYRGDWNMMDQIIVSSPLVAPGSKIKAVNATIFQQEWMMYHDSKYGFVPNKTYGGPNYYGGFSDHLPVFIDLIITP